MTGILNDLLMRLRRVTGEAPGRLQGHPSKAGDGRLKGQGAAGWDWAVAARRASSGGAGSERQPGGFLGHVHVIDIHPCP
jgi:hypothetical protein